VEEEKRRKNGTPPASSSIRFGPYELDLRSAELRKSNLRIRLQEQPFLILVALLERPGEVVLREEIRNRLWPDNTVVEFDHGINAAVKRLRDALCESVEKPRYIETLPRKGYRFIGKVEVDSSEQAKPPVEQEDGAAPVDAERTLNPASSLYVETLHRRGRGRHWNWALPGAAIILMLAAGLLYLRRPTRPPYITAYTQITHDGAQKTLVGTDGSRLYFDRAAKDPIGQVAVTGGAISAIPVPVPNFAFTEDVSPDGTNFLIATNGKGGIVDRPQWNVRLPVGSLRPLPDGGNAAFSPDGNSVAYQTAEGGLWVARSDGSGAHKLSAGRPFSILVAPPEAARPFFGRVAWSPDGSVLRFGDGGRLWEISASGSNLHEVIPGWHLSSNQCCGSWTPDGKLFAFLDTLLGPNEQPEIWALPESGGLFRRPSAEPVRLTTGPIAWGQPVPGKDGKKIFATGKTRRGELLRFDLKTRQFQPFLGGISAHMVSFSKDGQFVAYVSFPEDILWRANRDGTNPVQLTEPPIHALLPRWSPDGTKIVFVDFALLPTEAYIVAAAGGNPQKASSGRS
jgi:DNA-binding winged helix-turn-helix (wHTH) protein/Tol biopolymer transport system component